MKAHPTSGPITVLHLSFGAGTLFGCSAAGRIVAALLTEALAEGGRAASAEARPLAKRMVESWQGDSQRWDYHSAGGRRPSRPTDRDDLTLARLGDTALLEGSFEILVTSHYEGSENAALIFSVRLLGAGRLQRFSPV